LRRSDGKSQYGLKTLDIPESLISKGRQHGVEDCYSVQEAQNENKLREALHNYSTQTARKDPALNHSSIVAFYQLPIQNSSKG